MGSVAAHSGSVIRARSTSGRRVLYIGALTLGGILLALFFLAVLERIVYSGDVMPGVEVEGVDVAGKSEDDAYGRLRAAAATLETQPLRAKLGDKDVVTDPSVLAVKVDAAATLRSARRAGRSGNPVEQTLGTVLRRIRPDKVHLHVTYSEAGLDGVLDGWQREAASGGVEGALQFNGTQVVEVVPQRGMGIDREDAERRLVKELRSPGEDAVVLRVGELEPRISRAEVARAAARARELLTGSHELKAGTTTLTITPEQLASTLGTRANGQRLEITIDPDKLHAALGTGLAGFEVQPVNATFQVTGSNTVQVVPSVDGRQVDLPKVAAEMLAGDRRVVAPVVESHPTHDTAWAQSLGIKEQVSTFTTRHNAGEDRVVNIHRAADLLNNTVVEPGATFSLNDTIGPRTAERGFVVAPVFYGGETEDVGGGVSQVATTTFNAVFFGGYEDVYHKPHSIYISRYPMGREATVNYPTVDLKFRNDSKAGVLIRTSYSSTSITVTFYGDKEGKVVTEEGRQKLAEYPIVPQYFDCPGPAGLDKTDACAKLGAGETKLAESGHTGIDVEYFRVINRPGQEAVRQRFFWRYKMFPNKYLVGKGAPPTTAAPGATTAPTTPAPAAPAPTVAPTAPPAP
jgi:vancomycin resistance protein YoaR